MGIDQERTVAEGHGLDVPGRFGTGRLRLMRDAMAMREAAT
ncbi:hypothetical protein [Paraburkholderia sp. J63]|nr:hypothetical protein [Paraburkholderia sp. J63]